MFPKIPENLKALSAAALRELSRQIRAAAMEVLQNTESTDEQRAEAREFLAKRTEIITLAGERAEDERLAAELAADTSDDEPEPAPSTDPAGDLADESRSGDESESGDGAGDESADGDGELQDASKGGKPAKGATGFGAKSKPAAAPKPTSTLEQLVAYDGVEGHRAGEGFESWSALAQSLIAKSESVRADTTEKFKVAGIKAKYPQDRILGNDPVLNMAKFEPDEIQAALCAPATPYYGLACANVLRRPVFNSLPQFQAPRMKVSIPESPSLSDIVTGVGIWTASNDADPDAVKKACQTIECGTPTEFVMYGVYRCLTVKNMLAMSYPELMEAYLNRLGAAHSRLAEQTLLNAMYARTVEIDAPALGYGGSVTITSTILNYLALYQEVERWDVPAMEGWAPRWVMWGMKMDLMRRRRTNGDFRVPSDSEIDAMFAAVGVNIHWFMDRPSWAVAVPAVASGNTLNLLPQSVQILLAPRGKFAVMDRGELAIGVTGNNIYRDNQSNSRNEFTFFFENFEGIVDTTSCPAHTLDIPVCWSGVQIDDIVIACQGQDELGYQS